MTLDDGMICPPTRTPPRTYRPTITAATQVSGEPRKVCAARPRPGCTQSRGEGNRQKGLVVVVAVAGGVADVLTGHQGDLFSGSHGSRERFTLHGDIWVLSSRF